MAFEADDVLTLISEQFVPVAIDQHIHRRRKDAEGAFFAKVLAQAGRGLEGRSQGVFLCTAAGKLLAFSNTFSADRVKQLLLKALEKFSPTREKSDISIIEETDGSLYQPPEGGLVVDVFSRVLDGYDDIQSEKDAFYQTSIGFDHLWVRKGEAQTLMNGRIADSLKARMARFHLIDNTRGEPPMWREDEIRAVEMTLSAGQIQGAVHLETDSGDRGYVAEILGFAELSEGQIGRFDLVVKGQFWGEGTFTRHAPIGKFSLAIAFKLTDGREVVDTVLPGGARGNITRYLGN